MPAISQEERKDTFPDDLIGSFQAFGPGEFRWSNGPLAAKIKRSF